MFTRFQNVQAFQESSSLPFVHANQCSTSSAKNFDLFPVDPRMKIDARIINNHSVDFGCLERDRLNCELLEEQKASWFREILNFMVFCFSRTHGILNLRWIPDLTSINL